MWDLVQSFLLICVLLGCNAISYKINIDDEYKGALSGKLYHNPIVVLLMSAFYFLSVFIILGISIAIALKFKWYWSLGLFLLGYFVAFQILPKVFVKYGSGPNSIFFNGLILLITIPLSIWVFFSQYFKYVGA